MKKQPKEMEIGCENDKKKFLAYRKKTRRRRIVGGIWNSTSNL